MTPSITSCARPALVMRPPRLYTTCFAAILTHDGAETGMGAASGRRRLSSACRELIFADAHRKNYHRQPVELQPVLHFKRGLIVQEAIEEVLAFEDQLAGEEDRMRKFVRHLQAQTPQFEHYVGAQPKPHLGMKPEVGGEFAILLQVIH